ncbi:MAG: hypothetical protein QOF11_2708 [Chloroflexota bacterium]|jgi:hypothetical protein|nr:hypothetical protein [Chloroflexota bacterium]
MNGIGMLIAYDVDGNVIATLDHAVIRDENDEPIGLVDFAAHEEAGGEHLDVWTVAREDEHGSRTLAKGSKVWPEWIGGRAHEFRVELEGPPGARRIAALVHRKSGHRRIRVDVEGAIAGRIEAAAGDLADIRDLVGGPDRHLTLDDRGRTVAKVKRARPILPVLSRGDGRY